MERGLLKPLSVVTLKIKGFSSFSLNRGIPRIKHMALSLVSMQLSLYLTPLGWWPSPETPKLTGSVLVISMYWISQDLHFRKARPLPSEEFNVSVVRTISASCSLTAASKSWSQRVRHDWATELKYWSEGWEFKIHPHRIKFVLFCCYCCWECHIIHFPPTSEKFCVLASHESQEWTLVHSVQMTHTEYLVSEDVDNHR